MANMADARKEMTKTREQLEEEKRISLSIRIKPLDLDGESCNQRFLCHHVLSRPVQGRPEEHRD